ncbi:hypothetical protein GCM10009771_04720 [Nesterenkonia flava]
MGALRADDVPAGSGETLRHVAWEGFGTEQYPEGSAADGSRRSELPTGDYFSGPRFQSFWRNELDGGVITHCSRRRGVGGNDSHGMLIGNHLKHDPPHQSLKGGQRSSDDGVFTRP